MEENERTSDFCSDSGDNDEVEILEVIGIEDDLGQAPPEESFESAADDEYLLDLDAPPSGLNDTGGLVAEAGDYSASVIDNDGDTETDRQILMRLRADYDNLRKRIDRERSEFEFHANFALVGRLLPVMDNLERALAADSGPGGPLREGLVMIRRQLSDQLEQDGLTVIETIGHTFDPAMHDAVATEPSDEHPSNTILEELQKGYLFQNRVLRTAMVKVSTGEEGASDSTLPDPNGSEHVE